MLCKWARSKQEAPSLEEEAPLRSLDFSLAFEGARTERTISCSVSAAAPVALTDAEKRTRQPNKRHAIYMYIKLIKLLCLLINIENY